MKLAINGGAECVRSENAMQFSNHGTTSQPLRSQSLGQCIAGE